MNENMKYGLFFLGGLALGAIGAVAVSKGKLDLKPVAADLLSRGMDVKDAVLAKVENREGKHGRHGGRSPPRGGTAPGSEGRGLVLRCSPRAFSRCFR